MKRIVPLLLCLALIFTACGRGEAPAVSAPVYPASESLSADELARMVIAGLGYEPDSMTYINGNYSSDAIPEYVENFYGLASEEWSDCAIYRSAAADKAHEVSLFKLTEQADINEVFNSLEEYRHARQGDFFGYNPEQADLVDKALVSISSDGLWAAIFICENTTVADEAFFAALGMTLPEYDDPETYPADDEREPIEHSELGELPEYWYPYIDPEIDDMTLWDNTEFVAAVMAGDEYYLSREEKVLFKIVVGVLLQIIDEGMSDLEKEEAVYRWLTENVEYDHRHYEVPNSAPRESYEPMGAIASRKAVCLGFATAFQLFMDILDIECITVVGAAYDSREDHAWNMVKIDGEWYCVDATWDAGVDREYWNYFNVSSDYMAMTSHQWDYEAYPIAVDENDGNWADELWVPVE